MRARRTRYRPAKHFFIRAIVQAIVRELNRLGDNAATIELETAREAITASLSVQREPFSHAPHPAPDVDAIAIDVRQAMTLNINVLKKFSGAV